MERTEMLTLMNMFGGGNNPLSTFMMNGMGNSTNTNAMSMMMNLPTSFSGSAAFPPSSDLMDLANPIDALRLYSSFIR